MNNQFFYTRKEPVVPKEGEDKVTFVEFHESFNINKVIRSVRVGDKLLILLDDLHERTIEVPMQNKSGKVTGYKKDRNTYQSEIYLEGDDILRFETFTAIK